MPKRRLTLPTIDDEELDAIHPSTDVDRMIATAFPPKASKSKKAKTSEKTTSTSTTIPLKGPQEDSQNQTYFPLNASGNRRVTVKAYNGTLMVDVREFYYAGGELKPGKKGISLLPEQWEMLLGAAEGIRSALEDEGVTSRELTARDDDAEEVLDLIEANEEEANEKKHKEEDG